MTTLLHLGGFQLCNVTYLRDLSFVLGNILDTYYIRHTVEGKYLRTSSEFFDRNFGTKDSIGDLCFLESTENFLQYEPSSCHGVAKSKEKLE